MKNVVSILLALCESAEADCLIVLIFRYRYELFQHEHIFYRQLDFLSEPGVANEILENEPKNRLV